MEYEVYKQLDDFAKEFYDMFIHCFPNILYDYKLINGLEITVPAKVKEFGDIKIWLEEREITIGLGDHFHTHFERYSFDDDIGDVEVRKQIISEVIEFIDDVLNNRILLRVKMKSEKLISSSIEYLDKDDKGYTKMLPLLGLLRKMFPEKTKVETYTWSGRYNTEQ